MKAYNTAVENARNSNSNSIRNKQKQIQVLKKVHLEEDEFTEHKVLEHALIDFVVEAQALETSYQAHRKQMIQTVALRLEDELNNMGKPELVCHISEELIKILKQVGIKWNPIYLRRCLDERYKNPVNRLNALARQRHPGIPQDTGKTAEELEKSLNREPKSGWGQEYVVRTNAEYVKILSRRNFRKDAAENCITDRILNFEATDDNKIKMTIRIPVVAKAKPAEQAVTLELDNDTIEQNKRSPSEGFSNRGVHE